MAKAQGGALRLARRKSGVREEGRVSPRSAILIIGGISLGLWAAVAALVMHFVR